MMQANIVENIDDATEPGTVEIRRFPEAAGDDAGKVAGLAICCPGCGSQSWIPLDGSRGWTLVNLSPLEISPSIFHTKENGGCGWHGFLRNGEFKSC